MPKKRKFEVRVSVGLPSELVEFLDDLVERGVAESVSQAVRRCIILVKTYMPKVGLRLEPIEKEGEA